MAGGITVRGADVKEVLVESHSRGHRDSRESRPPGAEGMKRLNLPGTAGLDVVEENNDVHIKTSSWQTPADLMITVPRRSSLQLKCMNDGDIYVEHVDG